MSNHQPSIVMASEGPHIGVHSTRRWAMLTALVVLLGGLLVPLPGVLPLSPAVAAGAGDYGYPYPSAPDCNETTGAGCVVDKWNFYQGQCTSWVAFRLNAVNGVPFHNRYGGVHWGNATNWGAAARALGIAVNDSPAKGAVVWYSNGHVGYVEEVNVDGSVLMSEMNYDFHNGFRRTTIHRGSRWPTGFIHVKDLPGGMDRPVGSLDGVSSPGPGRITVAGWAFDPNTPDRSTEIHLYVGGPAGSPGARGFNLGQTSVPRPDVKAVYPQAGPNTGFSAEVTINSGGTVSVYAYAINTGPGENSLLGSKTVTVADPNPIGVVDEVSSPSPGQVSVRGWAFDPNTPSGVTTLHVYVGGPAGTPGASFFTFTTGEARPDVEAAHPQAGPRAGFRHTFNLGRSGSFPVHVYAINQGPGDNRQIGARTVSVVLLPGAPAAPRVAGDAGAVLVSWDAPASEGSSAVIGYEVAGAPGAAGCSTGPTGRHCLVSGLADGTALTFRVRARNGVGWSAWSPASPVVKTGPLAPSRQPQVCRAMDITGDGQVGARDLAILLDDWGTSSPRSDLNRDGTVNVLDLSLLSGAWGSCPAPPPPVAVVVAKAGFGNVLAVDVDPDRGTRSYSFRVQKRTSTGAWSTLPTAYATDGHAETKRITLGAGVFRVWVPASGGFTAAYSRPVTLTAPTVKVAVGTDRARDKLTVNVDPDRGSGYWVFKVQKRTSTGSWTTLPTSYRTEGSKETCTVNLRRGTYRVVVAGKYNYRGATSAAVTLVK